MTQINENDTGSKPLSNDDLRRMKRTPQAKVIRKALKLSQREFAAAYQISIGTLRDWEQDRSQPDQATRSYLKAIAREPEVIRKALQSPVR
jgi:putative transcriptional regulator